MFGGTPAFVYYPRRKGKSYPPAKEHTTMYALKTMYTDSYVKGYNERGMQLTSRIEEALRFHSIPLLLQFMSEYPPHHECGHYTIARIREVRDPRFVFDGVIS